MSILQKFFALIAFAVLFNSVSYAVTLAVWSAKGENGATLIRKCFASTKNGLMVYLVAGCGNQPEQAFEFLMDDLAGLGITFVNYRPDRGCDMKLIAEQVIDDIKANDFQKALIISCSIGDYVGRVCEAELGDRVATIPINPEPDSELLKPWAKVATRVLTPIARVLTIVLGWGSQWQGYSDCGNHFSSNFMVSQFHEIGYINDAPRTTKNVLGIIIAEADKNGKGEDEFLRGREAMRKYFGDVPIYSAVGVGHGNTVKGAEAYKKAWGKLWKKVKPRLIA